ncbi:MAG: hypothetical protein KDA41_11100, partial [Planctomycetales bacterium]|nr:hypothetical protein [Planctomycetales bacterium]
LTDPALLEQGVYKNPGVAHLDLVQSLAFSPDGKWLASGGYRNVKLWQRPESPQTVKLQGLAGQPQSLSVSADRKWIAVGEADGKVKVFDAASGQVAKTLAGHAGAVSAVAFSSTGEQLATGGQDKSIRVFSLADSKELTKIETPAPVTAVAFVLEDKQLAAGHADNKLDTWQIAAAEAPAEPAPAEGEAAPEAPKPIKEFNGHGGALVALLPVAGGAQMLSASQDGTLRLWDAAGGNMLRQYNHGAPVTGLAISPDGQKVASSSANNSTKLFRFDNAQQLAEVKGDYRARLRQDDAQLALALAQRQMDNGKKDLDAANARKKSEEENLKKSEEAVKKAEMEMKQKEEAAKKPVADMQAAEKELAEVKPMFEQAQTDKTKAEEDLKAAQEAQKAAQEKLNQAGDDQAKKDAAQKELEEANKKQQDAQNTLNEANKKFNELNTKNQQAENKVKQTTPPAQKAQDEHNAAVRAFEAGQRSVERGNDAVKKATDAVPVAEAAYAKRQEEHKQRGADKQTADQAVPASEKPVAGVAFSDDGRLLVSSGEDGLVHVWSAEDGAAVETYEGQGAPITALAALADGQVLALSGNSAGVVWDLDAPWQLVRTIGAVDSSEKFVDRVTALHFSPDSQLLATGGGEP